MAKAKTGITPEKEDSPVETSATHEPRERQQVSVVSYRAAMLISLLTVGLLVTSYYFYVGRQRAYFTNRNLRLLSNLAAQLGASLDTHQGFVRNYARAPEAPPALRRPRQDLLNEEIDAWLPDFDRGNKNTLLHASPANFPSKGEERFVRELQRRDGDWFIDIDYVGQTERLVRVGLPRIYPRDPAGTLRIPVEQTDIQASGTLPLSKLIDPLFREELLNVFDQVLITREDGSVMFTVRPAPSVDAMSEGAALGGGSGDELHMNTLTALQSQKAWREWTPLVVGDLQGATRHMVVSLSGTDYDLFAQPFSFAQSQKASVDPAKSTPSAPAGTATVATTSTTGSAQEIKPEPRDGIWLICGLVSRQRFTYQALAVSSSLIAILIGALILAICCWPFLRVILMADYQPLTVSDAILLGLSALTATAVGTLCGIDMAAYYRMRDIASSQMRGYAEQLECDLYSDIARAVKTSTALRTWSTRLSEKRPVLQDLRADHTERRESIRDANLPDIGEYPYFSFFAWIDREGRQRYAGVAGARRPLVGVSQRDYFKNVVSGHTWSVRDCENKYPPTGDFALDSVSSSTTGRGESVIALPTGLSDLPVFAVTVRMLHVMRPVLPPSFRFALIDSEGTVMFHSDEDRNRVENFFAETDYDRDLRSAVAAHHSGTVDVRYWGRDQRIYVKPMRLLPWTIIVMRDKSLLRSVNLEIILLTVVLLLINCMVYLLLLTMILIGKSTYRAASAWPAERNDDFYRRLLLVLTFSIITAALSIFVLTPAHSLLVGFIGPAQVITGTYLILHRYRKGIIYVAVLLVWAGTTLTWAWGIWVDPIMRDLRYVSDNDVITRVVLLVLLFATAVITVEQTELLGRLVPHAARWIRFPRTYVVCGVLLLIVVAVVPTLAFFKGASRLELETLVKYSQLKLAERIEQRVNHIDSLNVWPYSNSMLAYPIPKFFDSEWCLKQKGGVANNPEQFDKRCRADYPQTAVPWLADFLEPIVPRYSEELVSIRHFHRDQSDDGQWRWCRVEESDGASRLKLIKRVVFDPLTTRKIYHTSPDEQFIVISSVVPPLFLARLTTLPPAQPLPGSEGAIFMHRSTRVVLGIIAVIILARLMIWMSGFIARRILLIDTRRPLWLRSLPLSPTLGDHIFLSHTGSRPSDLAREMPGRPHFVDVSFREIENAQNWTDTLARIDQAEWGRHVRCVDFEYRSDDPDFSARKLAFFEALSSLPDRTILVISGVTPPFVISTAPSELRQRWGDVFSSFVWITAEQLGPHDDELQELRERDIGAPPFWQAVLGGLSAAWDRLRSYDVSARNRADAAAWLDVETSHNPYIRRLATELRDTVEERRGAVDEMYERAHTYYSAVWASCSESERVLLYQLARHSLINGNDRQLVRRLFARGLIHRLPNVQLFSETFRLFVLEQAQPMEQRVAREASASTWNHLRFPLLVILLSTTILIFATQKDLMNLTTGIVTALATGLPALAKLIGVFSERKSAAAEANLK